MCGEKDMSNERMTKSQRKIYDAIVKLSKEGVPPSIRELCNETGFTSTSTVFLHLNSLENKGYIEKGKGRNRCIRLKGDVVPSKVPLVGEIRAGEPILAVEKIEGYIPVSTDTVRNRDTFALKVVGDSMIKAGIYEGDTLVVAQQSDFSNGEIVVAQVKNSGGEYEATVKRAYHENGKIKLVPENDNYQPMIFDETEILGKVISLIREY